MTIQDVDPYARADGSPAPPPDNMQFMVEQLEEIEQLYLNAPIGLALFDRDLRFRRINAELAAMNGLPIEAHLGRVAWDVVPNLRGSAEPKLTEVLARGIVVDTEISGETPREPGCVRHWREIFYPLRDRFGRIVGIGAVVEDITERKRALADKALLAAIVASSHDAIASKTLEGIVTSWNHAAERLFGYSAEEMIGSSIRRIIPPDRQREEDMILGQISAGERVEHFETLRLTKTGMLVSVSVSISPLRDDHGRIVGASKIVRDISEQKATERRLAGIRDALSGEAQDPDVQPEETVSLRASAQTDTMRRRALLSARLLDAPPERAFDQTTQLACGVLQTPMSTFTAIDGDRQFFVSSYGLPEPLRSARGGPKQASYCQFVVESNAPVIIRDARSNPMACDLGAWKEGFVSYLGVPVRDRHGVVVAALAVVDSLPRPWTLRDLLTLQGLARQLMRELENRAVLAELAASESRLRTASASARFGMHETRVPEGVIIWSAEMARMVGLGEHDLEMPIEAALDVVHPDDRDDTNRKMSEIMDRVGPYEMEFRILRPDGEIRWLLDRGEAIGPMDPITGYVTRVAGIALDITERKQREEHVQLLMQEVNHRAKNMLAIVQSIARQTSADGQGDFLARFQRRIQALSANQDLLVRNQWQGVGMAELVREQLKLFEDLVDKRITINGPNVLLQPPAAQGIGLALHELATNAGKYGALSNATGRVEVKWQVGDGTFTITWSEVGGPLVAKPARKGFGTTVLTALAASSVNGEVDLDYAAEGLSWRLSCRSLQALDGPASHRSTFGVAP